MKVLYVNPNINHHKLPFFYELRTIYGHDNVIYATPKIEENWRCAMGFEKVESETWLLHITKYNFKEFERIFNDADIVLCSVRSYWRLMESRLKKGKLTFYFSERWFKEPIGKKRLLYPPIFNLVRIFRRLTKYDDFYILSQGITAAMDFFSCGIGRGKILSFGYFPPLEINRPDKCNIKLPKNKINILWAGRVITPKRVDLLAKAFAHIAKSNPNIHLTIIGDGPDLKKIERILSNRCTPGSYSHYGFMPNANIRDIMKQSDIYVLPSSGWEGWGAVINEAMAEECAIIGGDRVGAVTSIFDCQFGIKFKSGNLESLIQALEQLINNPELIETQKRKAVELINNLWSPKEAALRFVKVADAITNKQDFGIYSSGPFSIVS